MGRMGGPPRLRPYGRGKPREQTRKRPRREGPGASRPAAQAGARTHSPAQHVVHYIYCTLPSVVIVQPRANPTRARRRE